MDRLFWLSVNWTFSRFEIHYLERRKVHAKEATQLHTRGEGRHTQTSPGRTVPVSDLCDKYDLQPTVFYHWQQQFFENGTAAFIQGKDTKRKETQRIEQLEDKLRRKHEVLSELMEEHVRIKKNLGSFNRRLGSP